MLRRVQLDCYGRALAHAYFSDVAVILIRTAQTAEEIGKMMGTLKGRGGKVGAAILVEQPRFFPESDNLAVRGQIVQAFTVLEHPTVNVSSIGTGKTAEELAIELFILFHGCPASQPSQVFTGFPSGAVVPDDSYTGLNAWVARFQMFGSPGRPERCGLPLITPDEGAVPQTVTLTSATSGAAIYYTTDGSYPSSVNVPASTLYTAPISIAAACTLRCKAEKTGLQQSGIAQSSFT